MKHRMFDEYFETIFRSGKVPKNKVTPIDVYNVAQYLFGVDGKRKMKLYLDQIPNVACPWPLAWFECQYPGAPDGERWGMKLCRVEIPEDMRKEAFENDVALGPLVDAHMLEHQTANVKIQIETILKRFQGLFQLVKLRKTELPLPRWFQIGESFFSGEAPTKHLMFGGFWIDYVDEHGGIIPQTHRWYDVLSREDTAPPHTYPMPEIVLAYLAISFAHCKNVLMIREEYVKKEQKKHVKKYGEESVRFHKLHIDSLKMTLRREAGDDVDNQVRRSLPLHICRGHFKDFRQGAGLFGKHHGLYFWEQHSRGTKAAGRVEKEYDIK